METNKVVIDVLNRLLKEELTAINQYMVHAEMFEDWGYAKMGEAEEHAAIEEMKHAEKLIGRILYLGGIPWVSDMDEIRIGKTVPEMMENDFQLESHAVKLYNDAIKAVVAEGDNGTKDLLDQILKDEEGHIDLFMEQKDKIEQMGLQRYLTTIK